MNTPFKEGELLLVSCVLLGVGRIIGALEFMWLSPEFADGGLFGWDILRQRQLFRRWKLFERLSNWLYAGNGMQVICSTQLCGGAILVLASFLSHEYIVLGLLLVVSSGLLISLRNPIGQEGSDQMAIIVAISLVTRYTLSHVSGIALICHAFLAAQLILAYFAAGVAKLFGKAWRDGSAIEKILTSNTFGMPRIGKWLASRSTISHFVCWGTLVFECTFPLVLVAPQGIVWIFLGMALVFHIGNALLMGLNGFVWSFAAAYPSLIYITHWLKTIT